MSAAASAISDLEFIPAQSSLAVISTLRDWTGPGGQINQKTDELFNTHVSSFGYKGLHGVNLRDVMTCLKQSPKTDQAVLSKLETSINGGIQDTRSSRTYVLKGTDKATFQSQVKKMMGVPEGSTLTQYATWPDDDPSPPPYTP